METLKTVKHVRDTITSLNECKGFVINKQKQSEIERLILELQMLEESLLAKSPLMLAGLGQSSFGSMPIGSTPIGGLLQQQQQVSLLSSMPSLAPSSTSMTTSVQQQQQQVLQQQQDRLQVEAIASHMLPEIRSAVYGQQVTERQLLELVKRKVQGNLTIPTQLVDPVTILIVQQLKLESGVV